MRWLMDLRGEGDVIGSVDPPSCRVRHCLSSSAAGGTQSREWGSLWTFHVCKCWLQFFASVQSLCFFFFLLSNHNADVRTDVAQLESTAWQSQRGLRCATQFFLVLHAASYLHSGSEEERHAGLALLNCSDLAYSVISPWFLCFRCGWEVYVVNSFCSFPVLSVFMSSVFGLILCSSPLCCSLIWTWHLSLLLHP